MPLQRHPVSLLFLFFIPRARVPYVTPVSRPFSMVRIPSY